MNKETLMMEYAKLEADALSIGLQPMMERSRQGQFKSITLSFPNGQKVKTLNFWTARAWVTQWLGQKGTA